MGLDPSPNLKVLQRVHTGIPDSETCLIFGIILIILGEGPLPVLPATGNSP